MTSIATSCSNHHCEMKQSQAHSRVVQQLMFNRILSSVRLLSVDGVTIAGFNSKTGTLVCSHAGVNLVVEVSLGNGMAEPAKG